MDIDPTAINLRLSEAQMSVIWPGLDFIVLAFLTRVKTGTCEFEYHQNARLMIHQREQLARKVLEQGCTLKLAAASFNVSAKTAAKWVHRYREHGIAHSGNSAQGIRV